MAEIRAFRKLTTLATDDYTFNAGGQEGHNRFVVVHAHLDGEEPHDKHSIDPTWGGEHWGYRPIEGDLHAHVLLHENHNG